MGELGQVESIERHAAQAFEDAGVHVEPTSMPEDELAEAVRAGLLWVAVEEDGTVVGFAMAEDRRPDLLLRELDVHPDRARRGYGRALLDHVSDRARGLGYQQMVLTTFRDVPFNAPWYLRYGFGLVLPDTMPDWLVEIRRAEEDLGLDALGPRVAMALTL